MSLGSFNRLTEEGVVCSGIVCNGQSMFCVVEIRTEEFEDGDLLLAGQPKSASAARLATKELLRVPIKSNPKDSVVVLDVAENVDSRTWRISETLSE